MSGQADRSPLAVVLFDADGVVQLPADDWRSAWRTLISETDDLDAFLQDVFDAERPFLRGGNGFEAAVQAVLDRWGCAQSFDEVLRIWTMIETSADLLQIVKAVSMQGIQVGLATNQQSHRYDYMMNELAYDSIFDHLYVSFQMGVTKPETAYFRAILDDLPCTGDEVLFFDDHVTNVEAALAAGLNAHVYHLDQGADKMIELLGAYGIRNL